MVNSIHTKEERYRDMDWMETPAVRIFKTVSGEHLRVTTSRTDAYLQISIFNQENTSHLLKMIVGIATILSYAGVDKFLLIPIVILYYLQKSRQTVTKETIFILRTISGDRLQYSIFRKNGLQSTRYLPLNGLAISETVTTNRVIYNLIIVGGQNNNNNNSYSCNNKENVVMLKSCIPRLDCLTYVYNQIKKISRCWRCS